MGLSNFRSWVVLLALLALGVCSLPTPAPNPADVRVVLNGKTYVNKGLVGFGLIPSDFRESTGDTLGGIGSAMAMKLSTWRSSRGVFTGTFLAHPDRGFNINGTIDYQARQHEIDFVLRPYTGSANLSFADAQKTLQLQYKKTTLLVERNNAKTTGLDALAVRPKQFLSELIAFLDPEMPIATKSEPHLSLDVEGIVAMGDGTFWISDEYGPYIYRFTSSGHLVQTIQPPPAIVPRIQNTINFTSAINPTTGRDPNQGFEGLTLDPINQVLYTLLQSATIQDGGDDKSTSRYTRLLAYDIRFPLLDPRLVGEWVVPLPQNSKNNTLAASEVHFVSPGVFLALSRDGNGRGDDNDEAKYKQADLFSIQGATDIHGSKFDEPTHPVAVAGVLDPSIKPATYVGFANIIDPVQLARFGLHDGDPNDSTLIDGKWESLVLAPVDDPAFPDDYFLFTASDNDFISTNGVALGVPFNAGLDVDNQFLVFRLTLPGIPKGSVQRAIGVL